MEQHLCNKRYAIGHYFRKNQEYIMLILTRRVGETIIIDDDIEVTVLAVKGNQVRLGIKAPDHIAVHREEIYQRLMGENGGNNPPVAE